MLSARSGSAALPNATCAVLLAHEALHGPAAKRGACHRAQAACWRRTCCCCARRRWSRRTRAGCCRWRRAWRTRCCPPSTRPPASRCPGSIRYRCGQDPAAWVSRETAPHGRQVLGWCGEGQCSHLRTAYQCKQAGRCDARSLARGMPSNLAPRSTHQLAAPRLQGVLPEETRVTCTACAGTLLLEFGALSRLTGNPVYEARARHAMLRVFGASPHAAGSHDASGAEHGRRGTLGGGALPLTVRSMLARWSARAT